MNNQSRTKIAKRKQQQKRRRTTFFLLITIALIIILALGLMSCKDDTDKATVEPGSSSNTSQDTSKDSGEDDGGDKFSKIYYYEKDKAERYEAYTKENPDMSAEDVVWQVNASLDQEKYEDYTEIGDDANDILVLLNKYNKLPESYGPSDLTDVGSGIQMRNEAAEAYKKMSAEAQRENIDFIPQSGYRSYSYQEGLYNNYKAEDPEGADTYSARPGFSEHQTGLALDINVPSGGDLHNFDNTEQAEWVTANAHKFGFIVRYTEKNQDITGYISEPWHIRYIGTKHATNMYERKVSSYEEYKVKYIDHSPN